MPSQIRLQHLGSAARVQAVLWLALLALTLRALVPAGYMPDARALHDGRLEVTFCSAAGDLSSFELVLPSSGKGKAGHDAAGAGAQCPFGLLAHLTPAPVSTPTLLVLAAGRHVPLKPAHGALPSQGAHGPPLGSRAPPSSLA
ncbi:DUF2946 family protein [Achromobacter agilis]|uniref:DUF2946 domain-containing protein n=1 Tax=Achromobacter agilis TaxID=1353888 RepID=A0A446CT52_9BURK|nr:DUF2946 family protein [Achromobacter agilis]SSW71030.1 hypothetical protein AGI3411_04932 [Achromobacter agilis]